MGIQIVLTDLRQYNGVPCKFNYFLDVRVFQNFTFLVRKQGRICEKLS